jgi:putative DNA primase/helicase
LNNAELIEPEEPEDDELDYPTRFFHFGKSGRPSFKPALLAREILEQNQLITDPESGLTYRWNGQYWQEFGIREIRKIALGKLGIEASRSRAEDAAAQVADLSVLPGGTQLNPDPDILCLQNGQFNLRTGDVTRFNPDHLCTYQIGVSFDPLTPQPCPTWNDHLGLTVQIPEVIKEKQEFFGYCLTRSTRYEKALLLLGPGADGKSTSLNVLQALVGEENCSNVNLNSLDDQFHRVSLHNRVLNVFTEVQAKAFESDVFKAVVSGDRINAAYKQKDVFEFRPFCKLAFSSDHLPKVLDNSDGFFRKELLIKHRRQFFGPDRDPYLLDKLLDELPGIFAWAFVGLIQLRERGEFKLSQASQEGLNEYKEENNPVLSFIQECTYTHTTDLGEAPEVAKQDLYEEYAKFCKKRGFYPMNAIHFARELRQQMPEVEVVRRNEYVGQSKVRVRKYKGVGIAV